MPYKIKEVRQHLRNWKKLVRLYKKIMQIEEGSCLIALYHLLDEAKQMVATYKQILIRLRKEKKNEISTN